MRQPAALAPRPRDPGPPRARRHSPSPASALVQRFIATWCSWVASPTIAASPASRRFSRRTPGGSEAASSSSVSSITACTLIGTAFADAAAAEREDALDERLGAAAGMHHIVEVAAHDAAFGRGLLRELAVAEDRAEDIVEVVRDAAGERSHRFHFLRLAKLDFEPLLFRLGVLARGDVDRRPDEAMHLAGRIANAASARLQPVPFAIGMTNAVFGLVMIGPSLEMIARRGIHPGDVIGMNIDRGHPCFASGDRGIRTAAVQQLHLRRQERGSVLEIPVEMALVRAFHRQRVALLALAQRSFADFDAPELVHQRHDRSGAEQHENQRPRRDVPGLVAPVLERGVLVARNRDHQRELANMRDADETRLLIHGVQSRGRTGRSAGATISGNLRPTICGIGGWRTNSVPSSRSRFIALPWPRSMALIDALKLLEVDHRLHDAVEGSIRLFETPRHHDGGATLDLRDQRIAENDAEMGMVPVRDEIRPVGKRGSIVPAAARDRKRGIPCSSMILTSRTCGKPAARAASLASAAALGAGRSFAYHVAVSRSSRSASCRLPSACSASAFAMLPSSRWVAAMSWWYERQTS